MLRNDAVSQITCTFFILINYHNFSSFFFIVFDIEIVYRRLWRSSGLGKRKGIELLIK